jgi:hypothetical protein
MKSFYRMYKIAMILKNRVNPVKLTLSSVRNFLF